MLFRQADLAAIAAGEVTVAFRRWKRPMAKAGGSAEDGGRRDRVRRGRARGRGITPADARRAGFADPAAAWAMLRAARGRRTASRSA